MQGLHVFGHLQHLDDVLQRLIDVLAANAMDQLLGRGLARLGALDGGPQHLGGVVPQADAGGGCLVGIGAGAGELVRKLAQELAVAVLAEHPPDRLDGAPRQLAEHVLLALGRIEKILEGAAKQPLQRRAARRPQHHHARPHLAQDHEHAQGIGGALQPRLQHGDELDELRRRNVEELILQRADVLLVAQDGMLL